MTINITIREVPVEVPVEVRNELSARAAAEGKSMQEYLRCELIRMTETASVAAWIEGVRERKAVYNTRVTTKQILESRDSDGK